MVKIVNTVALNGIDGTPMYVEASIRGKSPDPKIELLGLPDTAVKEALGRVRAAAASSGILLHQGNITINLAPADVKKEGSLFDLPILLSIIDENIHGNTDLNKKCFAGELSLTGDVKKINGALSIAIAARDNGIHEIYLPGENALEASAAKGIDVYAVNNIVQLYDHLTGKKTMERTVFSLEELKTHSASQFLDYKDVKGQESAKKAIEIAVAGSHNILMIGPPGSGKSMLASRIPSVMLPITLKEAIETTKIYSVSGQLPPGLPLMHQRPFRAPHHNMSAAALAGGGKVPRPGEISLAHNGVLFLDEFPEFDKAASEVLRQPLEERMINITRVSGTVTYPCSFMLVCAMNPCKCGYYGHPVKKCTCSDISRKSYASKISGPLLDRIDIQIEVPAVEYSQLSSSAASTETSADIRSRIKKAREFAAERFKEKGKSNSFMTTEDIEKHCRLDQEGNKILNLAFDSLSLSARSYMRILKVARTVADLEMSEEIKKNHIMIALQMRSLDKKYFN